MRRDRKTKLAYLPVVEHTESGSRVVVECLDRQGTTLASTVVTSSDSPIEDDLLFDARQVRRTGDQLIYLNRAGGVIASVPLADFWAT